MRWQQPREWGQNHQREQIVATTTPPGQAYKKRGGESVRKCDFCNIYGFVGWFGGFVFLTKSQGFWKTGCSLSALLPRHPPFPFAGSPPYRAQLSKEGQTSWGDKWPHSRGRLCPEWEVTPEACLIFKAAIPQLSNLTLWAFIQNCYISVFPSCYGRSDFRDQLQIMVKRLSQQNPLDWGKSTMPLHQLWHTAVELRVE